MTGIGNFFSEMKQGLNKSLPLAKYDNVEFQFFPWFKFYFLNKLSHITTQRIIESQLHYYFIGLQSLPT